MKAYLILEDGTVFTGTSIGSQREVISEIVFNTSMTGYLEVLTDPSYAGQAVVMTYPLIGNYGICYEDMESDRPWPDGYIVRELSRIPSNFRSEDTIQNFLEKYDIPGISGVDTRALTKILREKGTMNGMITTREYDDLTDPIARMHAYTVTGVVKKTSCKEKYILPASDAFEKPIKKVALLDLGAKRNIARSLAKRGCEVTVYPCDTTAEEILATNPDGIMLSRPPRLIMESTSAISVEIPSPLVMADRTSLIPFPWTATASTAARSIPIPKTGIVGLRMKIRTSTTTGGSSSMGFKLKVPSRVLRI